MLRRIIMIVAVLGVATASVLAGGVVKLTESAPVTQPKLAAPAPPTTIADSASCASTCQSRHDQCRVQTKGSSSCDGERQRCLQACLQKKSK